jgi:hypothetical protein
MFNKWEAMVFALMGKIVAVVGFVGALMTIYIDQMAGRPESILGPMQIFGVIAFVGLALFGMYADILLNDTIKPMIKSYLES